MLLILCFVAIFGFAISAGLLLFYRENLAERLQALVDPHRGSEGVLAWVRRRPSRVEAIIKPFQNVLPRSPEEVSVVQKRLIRAGFRSNSAVNVFYAAKVLVPIVLTLLATITRAYELGALFAYGLSAGLGFLLPDFWVGNRMAARQRKIRLGLPEALDMMVVCTEAGLGLDQAIYRVAQEMKGGQPEIHDELILINLEQKAGRPRDEALKNFAARTDIDTVRALVTTLVQADQFGTSIAKTLRVYSDTLRTSRRQRAEEQAAKTTVKLVFPLLFFIFPSVFVVALGPSAITLWEGLTQFLG